MSNETNSTILVKHRNIADFFTLHKKLQIPHYQRKYSWGKSNCETMLEDILQIVKNERTTHFFSNVTLSPVSAEKGYSVVDGQQRLTTFCLFLRAIQLVFPCQDESISAYFRNGHLLNLSFEDPIDQRTYRHIMLGRFCDPKSLSESMHDNFQYFTKTIEESKETLVGQLDSKLLKKLLIVEVILPKTMPPQRIFERMNAIKVEITAIDLIKNFLLMKAENEEEVVSVFKNLNVKPCLKKELWKTQLLASIQENRYISINSKDCYKPFKEFYNNRPNQETSTLEFLNDFQLWSTIYESLVNQYNNLVGGVTGRPQERFGALFMKIAIVFSSENDKSIRCFLISLIARHMRSYIVRSRLEVTKLHRSSWDRNNCYKCLKKTKGCFSKNALKQSIIEAFPSLMDNEYEIDNAIRNWVNQGGFENGPYQNIDIIALDWINHSNVDSLIANFHQKHQHTIPEP